VTPFSEPFLHLLSPVLAHLLSTYEFYVRRWNEMRAEQERAGVSVGEVERELAVEVAAPRANGAGPASAAAASRPLPHLLTPSRTSSSSPSFSYYRTFDLLVHFAALHRGRWMNQAEVGWKAKLWMHLPETFSADLLSVISSCSQAYSSLVESERRWQRLDSAMREWLGIKPLSTEEPPSSALASLSPYFTYCLPFSLTISDSLHLRGGTAAWKHAAPVELYLRANTLVERLCVDTNTDFAADLLHWMHCATMNRLALDGQEEGWRMLVPRNLWPLAAMLHAYPSSAPPSSPSLSSSPPPPHPLVQIGFCIEKLSRRPAAAPRAESAESLEAKVDGDTHMRDDAATPASGASSSEAQPASNPHPNASAIWLLLTRSRHVLDHAVFLLSQASIPMESALFHAVTSLLAIHLAPGDARVRSLLRFQLAQSKRSLSVGTELALDACVEQIEQATSSVVGIRPPLMGLIAPLVPKDLAVRFLDRLVSEQAAQRHTQLLRHTQRWVVGAMVETVRLKNAAGAAASSPPQTSSAVTLISLASALRRRQQRETKIAELPSQESLKAAYDVLHPMLKAAYDLSKVVSSVTRSSAGTMPQ
jgi:hypothetical protein